MADIGGTITGAIPKGSTVGLIIMIIVVGLIVLVIVGAIGFYIWNKKRWNLKVEIKLPRSDGKIVNGEWGKGYFDPKQGVVFVKRPGFMMPKIPLQIFDPKRYLQGIDLLTVIQLSPVDYRPILPISFLEYQTEHIDDKTGKKSFVKEAVMEMECDKGQSKAWQVSFDAAAKKAYSLQSFFTQFQMPITIAMVVLSVFIGVTALWTQLPK